MDELVNPVFGKYTLIWEKHPMSSSFEELARTSNSLLRDVLFLEDGKVIYWDYFHIEFSNGYMASVIRTPFSYGGRDSLFEMAILNAERIIDYSTPITSDVLGYLTREQVGEYLELVEMLPFDSIQDALLKPNVFDEDVPDVPREPHSSTYQAIAPPLSPFEE